MPGAGRMAWQETPTKVVVEFLRSNQGTSRVIKLKHTPQAVPPQLQGRVDPVRPGEGGVPC